MNTLLKRLLGKKATLVIVLLVFGIVGLVMLISSRAASPFVSAEVEDGAKNNVPTVTDSTASAGIAIKFVQAGTVQPGVCSGTAPAAYAYTPLSGRGWPTAYGQSYIATWKDDKIAVTTLSIDDNIKGDHEYWKQKAAETGFKFTWFVVTKQDANGVLTTGATWNDFRSLYASGHSIQSHTVTHSAPSSESEFQQSQIDIQREIGVKPLTVAYPDGDNSNSAVAAKYYISGRGTVGWLNSYKPDYMNISSLSTYMNTNGPNNYNYAPALLDKSFTQDSGTDFYRGWMSIHYHSIATDKVALESHLSWLKAREVDMWVAGFDHASAYARERDMASLSVTAAGTNCVAFNVIDTLANATYTEPLTVKVRLQDTADWSSVSATQNGKAITAKIVTNGTNRYALVDAVPDAGLVTVYNPSFK